MHSVQLILSGYSFVEELPFFTLIFGIPVMSAASSVRMCRGL